MKLSTVTKDQDQTLNAWGNNIVSFANLDREVSITVLL